MFKNLNILAIIFLGLFLSETSYADLKSSRPSSLTIKNATSLCRLTTARIENEIVGISDPNTLDPNVINLISETGVKWVRAEFHWSQIEDYSGNNYNWTKYDEMVKNFHMKGINIQAIITYIPQIRMDDWETIDKRFQKFVKAIVRRYAPQGVHYWEVFNEPNLTGYGWLSKQHKAEDFLGAYTLLLARANNIIRQNDPNGIVILGGLASEQHRGLSAEQSMETIYKFDAHKCFDIMAYHPYGYQNRFPEARTRVNAILAKANDHKKPVWFNEYGWTDYKSMDLKINKDVHSNPMIAAFNQKDSSDAFFWFSAKDYSGKFLSPTFGLANFRLKKRPSFETFRQIIHNLNSKPISEKPTKEYLKKSLEIN